MTGRGHLTRSARWKLICCGSQGSGEWDCRPHRKPQQCPRSRKGSAVAGFQKVEQKKSSLTRVTEESWSPHEGKVRIHIRKSGALKLAEGRVRHDPSSQGTTWGKQLYQHHLSTQMSRPKTKMLPGQHMSLKEAAGRPWSKHSPAGQESPQQKPSAVHK